ncbi:MAG: phosphate signaling complex protein PhoU [Clostridia bacterium]|nr:phosphate signaling complex protein PhoU [Clostridia bacterium]
MRHLFDKELKTVTEQVIQMGHQVDQMLKDVVLALKDGDVEKAIELEKYDDEIDQMENQIENLCIDIIATQCPIARDLRRITTILRMISDLERIADHCVNIARIVIENKGRPFMKPLVDLPNMQDICSVMIHDSIESFIHSDYKQAYTVINRDDEVDAIYEKIYIELLNILTQNNEEMDPVVKEQVIMLLLIGRYLERIADHATNVSERVIYMVTGKLVKG